MKSAFTILLAVVLFIQKGIGNTVEKCCNEKTVGVIAYSLVEEGHVPDQCLNGCIYKKDSDPAGGQKFCFASGLLPVECIPTEEPGVWTTAAPPGPTGLIIMGGDGATNSTVFWTPDGGHCKLPDTPDTQWLGSWGSTIDYVNGQILALPYYLTKNTYLHKLTSAGWTRNEVTLQKARSYFSTAVTNKGLLLVGGRGAGIPTEIGTTTEILPGPSFDTIRQTFNLQDGWAAGGGHCSIQVSESIIILTGGEGAVGAVSVAVSEISGIDTAEPVFKRLSNMNNWHTWHACGIYSVGGTQKLIVAGGQSYAGLTASTEVLDYPVVSQNNAWRTVGPLPVANYGPSAGSISGNFYIVGGYGNVGNGDVNLNAILSFDADSETWTEIDRLANARNGPAVATVPLKAVSAHCPDLV